MPANKDIADRLRAKLKQRQAADPKAPRQESKVEKIAQVNLLGQYCNQIESDALAKRLRGKWIASNLNEAAQRLKILAEIYPDNVLSRYWPLLLTLADKYLVSSTNPDTVEICLFAAMELAASERDQVADKYAGRIFKILKTTEIWKRRPEIILAKIIDPLLGGYQLGTSYPNFLGLKYEVLSLVDEEAAAKFLQESAIRPDAPALLRYYLAAQFLEAEDDLAELIKGIDILEQLAAEFQSPLVKLLSVEALMKDGVAKLVIYQRGLVASPEELLDRAVLSWAELFYGACCERGLMSDPILEQYIFQGGFEPVYQELGQRLLELIKKRAYESEKAMLIFDLLSAHQIANNFRIELEAYLSADYPQAVAVEKEKEKEQEQANCLEMFIAAKHAIQSGEISNGLRTYNELATRKKSALSALELLIFSQREDGAEYLVQLCGLTVDFKRYFANYWRKLFVEEHCSGEISRLKDLATQTDLFAPEFKTAYLTAARVITSLLLEDKDWCYYAVPILEQLSKYPGLSAPERSELILMQVQCLIHKIRNFYLLDDQLGDWKKIEAELGKISTLLAEDNSILGKLGPIVSRQLDLEPFLSKMPGCVELRNLYLQQSSQFIDMSYVGKKHQLLREKKEACKKNGTKVPKPIDEQRRAEVMQELAQKRAAEDARILEEILAEKQRPLIAAAEEAAARLGVEERRERLELLLTQKLGFLQVEERQARGGVFKAEQRERAQLPEKFAGQIAAAQKQARAEFVDAETAERRQLRKDAKLELDQLAQNYRKMTQQILIQQQQQLQQQQQEEIRTFVAEEAKSIAELATTEGKERNEIRKAAQRQLFALKFPQGRTNRTQDDWAAAGAASHDNLGCQKGGDWRMTINDSRRMIGPIQQSQQETRQEIIRVTLAISEVLRQLALHNMLKSGVPMSAIATMHGNAAGGIPQLLMSPAQYDSRVEADLLAQLPQLYAERDRLMAQRWNVSSTHLGHR